MGMYGTVIGHDTEMFIIDKTKDGEPVPAHLVFPPKEEAIGTKDKREVYSEAYGKWIKTPVGSIYRDGYAVEINSAPNTCRAFTWNDWQTTYEYASGILFKAMPTARLSFTPYVDIDLSALRSMKPPKDVMEFGCSPTYNAYRGRVTQIRRVPSKTPFRTAAAHIHISFHPWLMPELAEVVEAGPSEVAKIIKVADFLIGIPITWLFSCSSEGEKEFKRRSLYGKAGEFRIHHHENPFGDDWDFYGTEYEDMSSGAMPTTFPAFEYRVLSPRIMQETWLWSLASGLLREVVCPNFDTVYKKFTPAFERELETAINTGKGLDDIMTFFLNSFKGLETGDLFSSLGKYPSLKNWETMKKDAEALDTTYVSFREGHNGIEAHLGGERW